MPGASGMLVGKGSRPLSEPRSCVCRRLLTLRVYKQPTLAAPHHQDGDTASQCFQVAVPPMGRGGDRTNQKSMCVLGRGWGGESRPYIPSLGIVKPKAQVLILRWEPRASLVRPLSHHPMLGVSNNHPALFLQGTKGHKPLRLEVWSWGGASRPLP